jgi:hypothetical protein
MRAQVLLAFEIGGWKFKLTTLHLNRVESGGCGAVLSPQWIDVAQT